jgi:hypothetical protein
MRSIRPSQLSWAVGTAINYFQEMPLHDLLALQALDWR